MIYRDWKVFVVEILCENKEMVNAFQGRNAHGVGGGVVGKMWGRWEKDPDALLFYSSLSSLSSQSSCLKDVK